MYPKTDEDANDVSTSGKNYQKDDGNKEETIYNSLLIYSMYLRQVETREQYDSLSMNYLNLFTCISELPIPSGYLCKTTTANLLGGSSIYRGLVNPACICYLNSVMQQLFMIKPFRKAILNLDLNREILHKSP